MKKVFSLALCLVMILSLVLPTTAFAEDTTTSTSGMVVNKTAVANDDGSYTITLEAYGTGDKVTTTVTNEKPTDIVLVLDQSGSMDDDFGSYTEDSYVSYGYQTNAENFALRHNNGSSNLWYKLPDGSYASVSVEVTNQALKYNPVNNIKYSSASSLYQTYSENLYVKGTDGEYYKVTINRTGSGYSARYSFSSADGSVNISNQRSYDYPFWDSDLEFYTAAEDATKNVYTYTCTADNGTELYKDTSTGADTTFNTEFYQLIPSGTKITRLKALQIAAKSFATSVAAKTKGSDGIAGTADDVNHRIAVVGFAHGTTRSNEFTGGYNYVNTELFIGSNEYTYGTNATAQYANAFQDMSTTQGATNVNNSIGALSALGATQVDLGMNMAEGILNANPLKDQDRNKVVIVFTDGFPSKYSNYSSDVASNAISKANMLKQAGVTVYAIGVFEGADATSYGNSNGDNTQKANWFLQNLSSNNGTPRSPSYYLSAADSSTLTNIFQQISNQIQSGGSSTTLSSETVIKDIISPAFTLPAGATADNITLETYHCTGKNGNDFTWSNNNDTKGASASVNGDQVSVRGFDFAANYVGTETVDGKVTYRGDKLVIKFNVTPKAGFLGGNDVYTNTSAGVYENDKATEPVLTFNRPQVNVPIKDVSVTATNKDVYLLGGLTADEIKDTTVTVGGVTLDLGAENYGLEDWQHEYVTITVAITDKDGNAITDLTGLTDDNSYTVSVTVAPQTETPTSTQGETAVTKSNNGTGMVNVYKPVLTFKDGSVYYGEAVPTNFTDNLVSTAWKHGNDTANTATMGADPTLIVSGVPDASKITEDGKVNTKTDIAVNATVKMGETDVTSHSTFAHQACNPACGWDNLENKPAFLLHVKTCQLTITKNGGAADEPYVFTVYRDGKEYTEVTVIGNTSETIYELPVGTYTIKEDTGWSWRYAPSYKYGESETATNIVLGSGNTSGTITCTNRKDAPYWLNSFSEVVKNIFNGAEIHTNSNS